MIYAALFLALAYPAYRYFRYRFIPKEVRENAADFDRNGSADDLQVGYHQREFYSRVWPGLACCVVPAVAPALLLVALHWLANHLSPAHPALSSRLWAVSWWAVGLASLAMAALLAGVFARDFTPKLNLARLAAGQWWITEWTASAASKSSPDATAWVRIRRRNLPADQQQPAANTEMKDIVRRTYYLCLAASLLLAGAAVAVALR